MNFRQIRISVGQLVGSSPQENLLLYSFFFLRRGSRYVAQAGEQGYSQGVIPLLISTGVLTSSVSDLGRFHPAQATWKTPTPGGHHIDDQRSVDTGSALLTTANNSQAQDP